MRWGLHSRPEEHDVDLIDGKVQESTPGVRDIWTETRPHDAVPSWPVCSIKLLSAKDETLSVSTGLQSETGQPKWGNCGQIVGICGCMIKYGDEMREMVPDSAVWMLGDFQLLVVEWTDISKRTMLGTNGTFGKVRLKLINLTCEFKVQ